MVSQAGSEWAFYDWEQQALGFSLLQWELEVVWARRSGSAVGKTVPCLSGYEGSRRSAMDRVLTGQKVAVYKLRVTLGIKAR